VTGRRTLDAPARRLMFWLWTPYLSDAALIGIGWWLVATGDAGGWWAIVFAAVRAVLGTVAILLARKKFRAEN
jgi:LPXTG-motif cell wall-anchored protein